MATITMMARMLTTAMTSGLELGEGVGVISEDGLGLRVEEDIVLSPIAVAWVSSEDHRDGSSTSRFQARTRNR